jgi:uncharacterized protein
MDPLWIALGAAFVVAGFVGSFLPVIPGPPLSYMGVLFLQFTRFDDYSWMFFLGWGAVVAVVAVLDYLVPAMGTRRFGGSAWGVWGCLIGGVAGLFLFPPIGLLIGPVAGAFAGELIAGKQSDQAFRAAVGSFLGFLLSTGIKVAVSLIMAYYFVKALL